MTSSPLLRGNLEILPWIKEKILRLLMISMSLLRPFSLRKTLDKDRVRKILLIQFGGLGDMVLITPAIKSIIKTFPQAKICILGFSEYNSNFLLNFPNVVEVKALDIYSLDMRQIFRLFFWRELFRMISFLRKGQYDLLITFRYLRLIDWLFIEWLLVFFSRARYKVGVNPDFLLRWSIYDRWIIQTELLGRHYVDFFLKILETAGVSGEDRSIEFPVSKGAFEKAEEFLSNVPNESPLVCIHVGGTRLILERELWDPKNYLAIIKSLTRQGLFVILVGSQEDSKRADMICQGDNNKRCLDLTGKTTIEEMAAIIKGCRLFIGNDSGPFHVAVAVGTPAIGIFSRKDDEPEYYLYKMNNVYVFRELFTEKAAVEGVLKKAKEFLSI